MSIIAHRTSNVTVPEKDMIVLTITGCTGSPSVAIKIKGCPWMVICAGHTEAKEFIIRNLYLRPGVMVNVSSGVLVL